MGKLVLTFIDEDSWSRPVYKDQNGRLFKNVNLKKNNKSGLCTVYGGFDGEPDTPIQYTKYKEMEIEFIEAD